MGTLTKLNKRIKARNRAFAKLSPEQKRVTIAKDVLEQLDAGRLTPTQGTYLSPRTKVCARSGSQQLAELLPRIEKCNVCGLGALFACAVGRADKITLSEVGDFFAANEYRDIRGGDDIRKVDFNVKDYLLGFFNSNQLRAIEHTFEQWTDGVGVLMRGVPVRRRMVLIMENIIRNGGTFEVGDETMMAAVTGAL